jgi:hypothetical protein
MFEHVAADLQVCSLVARITGARAGLKTCSFDSYDRVRLADA